MLLTYHARHYGSRRRLICAIAVALLLLTLSFLTTGHETAAQNRTSSRRTAQPARRTAARPATAPIPVATANLERLPAGYLGHSSVEALNQIFDRRAQLAKSQFGTTTEHRARLAGFLASINLPGGVTADGPLSFTVRLTASYDADGGVLHLRPERDYLSAPTVYTGDESYRLSSSFTPLVTASNARTHGSRVGRTAFGVRRRYVVRSYGSLALALAADRFTPWAEGIFVPLSPVEARVVINRLRVALTGRIVAPFVAYSSDREGATLSDPEEAYYHDFYLFFRPDTLLVYDQQTGEIYGAVELGPTPPASHNQTIVLESPAVRRERAAAAAARQREIDAAFAGVEVGTGARGAAGAESGGAEPQDYIFRRAEVEVPARITHQPQPIFPAEARERAVEGTVIVRAVLRRDGRVSDLEVVSGLPHGLTEAALAAAREIRFEPARYRGRPVSQYVQIVYQLRVF